MSPRRTLPPEEMARRRPFLAIGLVLVVAGFALFGLGKPVLAFTALIAAFLAVALAKRA
jgi:uncharacterized membrane protein